MADTGTLRSSTEQALLVGAAVSAALLGGAHAFEANGYAPCPLCLDQRQAHWLALAVCLGGFAASLIFGARLAAGAAVGAAAFVYAVSAGLAGYHTGVEWHFWPGPKTCGASASAPASVDDLMRGLSQPTRGPACETAQWRLFGVSMAGYNFLISCALMAVTLAAALNAARAAGRARRAVRATAHAASDGDDKTAPAREPQTS
jgi:disulfide bond formation protein DsbB